MIRFNELFFKNILPISHKMVNLGIRYEYGADNRQTIAGCNR